MAFDFQKLGVDRLAQNVARSINNPKGGNLTTGSIGDGEVVEVNVADATTTIRARATGAILIGTTGGNVNTLDYTVSGGKLTLTFTGTATGLTFWVF